MRLPKGFFSSSSAGSDFNLDRAFSSGLGGLKSWMVVLSLSSILSLIVSNDLVSNEKLGLISLYLSLMMLCEAILF